jgi:hypothetical protein
MAKRKPANTKAAVPQKRTRARAAEESSRALPEPLLARVRQYCRSNASSMVMVGAYFDQLYASEVLDLRRRVSLGLASAQDIESVTAKNDAVAGSRKIRVEAEPDGWVATQEWSIDPTSWRHQRLRLLAALHDFEHRVLPKLDSPHFIADNALCALFLTWMVTDDGIDPLRPHTCPCQAVPWTGEHGRQSLAGEWFTAKRVADWARVLERSLEILGDAAPRQREQSVSVHFQQSVNAGEVAMVGGGSAGDLDADAVTPVAHTVVRLTAAELRTFDAASLSLARIGRHYFQLVHVCAGAVSLVRGGGLGFVDIETWARIHTQFRLAVEFARRCVGGLGPRLLVSGLVPNAAQIEKRAGEIVDDIKHLELMQNGAAPGERLHGVAHMDRIQLLAHELASLGASFANVSPAAELDGLRNRKLPEHYDTPLTEPALLIAAVLCQQPPDHGLKAAEIVVEVERVFKRDVDETTVKRTISGPLRAWGARHSKGVGYHVPPSRRLELWTRIQPTLALEYPSRRVDS